MAMYRNNFTEEQVEILRKSPYVRSVSESQVSFTSEFKDEFWRLYTEEDMLPYDILRQLGIDYYILGSCRVQGITNYIKKKRKCRENAVDERKAATLDEELLLAQEVKRLRMEVEYLRQEQEFLKKITMAGRDGK